MTAPRIEAEVQIDGALDEAVWEQAARLDSFWQQEPVDGRPAEERSEVRVWYSPSALHFGIIAYDRDPSSIRATVADRDSLDQDDSFSFFLDTFNDQRRAFVFTVNPLGIQEDGVHSEGVQGSSGSFDKNPDYQFDSQGRLTEEGYVVEVRIPFKSLRYAGGGPQRWGFNVRRRTQRTGYLDTWTQVRRASASFLAQSGVLEGLHDLRRGVVKELQPVVTGINEGLREPGGAFGRASVDVSGGLNARLGFTNVSLDATINPDFSQVESDAGLVTVNERFALFVPEKRPFFLEGIELFATPNDLVYTRRILDPIAGGKVTGKIGPFSVAHLTAVDETPGDDVLFNITRFRRDFGRNSIAGLTYTDRTGGGAFNRVASGDVRVVFGRVYYVQGQLGRSWTDAGGGSYGAPLWNLIFDRTGRAWGFNYNVRAVGEDFETQAGFVPRSDMVSARANNRFSLYGARGALLENFTIRGGPQRIWRYDDFARRDPLEGEDNVTIQTRLRGGWAVNLSVQREYYRFEPEEYEGYAVLEADGTLAAFTMVDRADNLFNGTLTVETPTLRLLKVESELTVGELPIFPEAAEGRDVRWTATMNVRPTTSVRVETIFTVSRITRQLDGTEFARTVIPRLKLEYQPRRSLFFRFVGEYRSQRRAALRQAVSGAPLAVGGVLSAADEVNTFRADWLASYEPTPGTAAYFGYGSSLEANRTLNFTDLSRTSDGFFAKLAYQFRW